MRWPARMGQPFLFVGDDFSQTDVLVGELVAKTDGIGHTVGAP